jgi:peptidoglycan/LPS O-acetylase OafA/YrhL
MANAIVVLHAPKCGIRIVWGSKLGKIATLKPGQREYNNLGFVRLALALLVIFSHSPSLIDGNPSRELLTRLVGTISFGELAVYGFFLISGYLILQSFIGSKSNFEYLAKRVLRIYPGYCVAFIISLLIGVAAGGKLAGMHEAALDVSRVLTLHTPVMHGVFSGTAVSILNGSMWTISYEFRCYIMVMLMGACGILRRRWMYLALIVIVFLVTLLPIEGNPSRTIVAIFGDPECSLRFFLMFLCGGAFFLFRDRIRFEGFIAWIATTILIGLLRMPRLVVPSLLTLGAYALFTFAFAWKSPLLGRVGSRVDLSYGMYLYAWPIQGWLIWHYHHISTWSLFAISASLASCCAFVSWTVIEKPALALKKLIPLRVFVSLAPTREEETGTILVRP